MTVESTARAVVDAFLPPLVAPVSEKQVKKWEERASANPETMKQLMANADERIQQALTYLSTGLGTSILTGKGTSYALEDWPVAERSALFQKMRTSNDPMQRRVFSDLQQWVASAMDVSFDASGEELAVDISAALETQPEAAYDVLILGNTPCAWVAASVAAGAGYSVLLLDETTQVASSTLDGSIRFTEGIIRSSLLPLPAHVQKELIRTHGLKVFGEPYLKAWTQVVGKVAAVWSARSASNTTDDVLLAACKAAGLRWERVEPVTLKNSASIPIVATKCYSAKKESQEEQTVFSVERVNSAAFCREAVELGVRVVPSCTLETICITGKSFRSPTPKATGVQLRVGDRNISIIAKRGIIVAGGALKSPAWLRQASSSRHLGRHLRLQPAAVITGFGKCLRPGAAPLPSRCSEFDPISIESPRLSKEARCQSIPWTNPSDYRHKITRLLKSWPLLVSQRDRGEGCLKVTNTRRRRRVDVDYTIDRDDLKSLLHGLQGASELHMLFGLHDQSHETLKEDAKPTTRKFDFNLVSSHPTGTCRMSANPGGGVVGPDGAVWDCDNVFVMDSSILPEPPGVDPSLVSMSLALLLTKRLTKRWDNTPATELPKRADVDLREVAYVTIRTILALVIVGFLASAWFFDVPVWLSTYS